MPTANGGGKRSHTARKAWTTLPAQKVRHLIVASTWCLTLGGLGCAETTSLCPDFPLDHYTANFIRSQDARHNRLASCLQGHPKTALMGCPCKRQPSHASQPPLRCGCLHYVLCALPLINRGASWTVQHSVALLKVYRLRLSVHY